MTNAIQEGKLSGSRTSLDAEAEMNLTVESFLLRGGEPTKDKEGRVENDLNKFEIAIFARDTDLLPSFNSFLLFVWY